MTEITRAIATLVLMAAPLRCGIEPRGDGDDDETMQRACDDDLCDTIFADEPCWDPDFACK